MKISEKLFFCAYGLYLIFCLLNASFYAIYIYRFIKPIMILCVVIEVIRECFCVKLSRKELIFMFLCIVLSSLLSLNMNGIVMLPLFIFIYGARTIEFKKIARFTVIISSSVLILVIISAKLGIITDYITQSTLRKRDYLGFRYPLFPQMILFNITLADLYINKEHLTIKRCIFYILANYVIFKFTDSRLSFYLAIILIISIYTISKNPKIVEKLRLLSFILIFSFPILCITSLIVTLNYDYSNSTMRELNDYLGGRLYLGKSSLADYKINAFGNNTKYIGAGLDINGKRSVQKYNYVDCMYINLLEKYGVIFNIIFLGLLTYLSYKSWKKRDYTMLIILAGLALHGVIDDLEIYLYYNVFWMSISIYFNKDVSKLTDKEYKNKMKSEYVNQLNGVIYE